MNTSVTSRDTILSVSRQFITQNGFGSVNMRAIAAACGVSVGSVYNYFPSKGDLICAVVESVWHDIFHLSGQSNQFSSFTALAELFCKRKAKGQRDDGALLCSHPRKYAPCPAK